MTKISYSGYRFPTEIIQQVIWLYVRFTLSFRDVEDLLTERGIVVSYETVRRWVNHFGPRIAANLRKRRSKPQPIKLDQFAPRVALGEASAHDASLSRGRLNTGKFAALKLFCAYRWNVCQRMFAPLATKYHSTHASHTPRRA